jgi:heterotetrameric sarcosine oxidase gamma subunit
VFTAVPARRTVEVVLVRMPMLPLWTLRPGGTQRDAQGRLAILRIAPDRYLLPEPDESVIALAKEAVDAKFCAMIEVSGKWQCFRLVGARGRQVLAVSVNVEALLEDRGCASTTIFDCPAVVAQEGAGFRIWIARSFATSFSASISAQLAVR